MYVYNILTFDVLRTDCSSLTYFATVPSGLDSSDAEVRGVACPGADCGAGSEHLSLL